MDNSVFGGVFDSEFAIPSKKLFNEILKGLFIPVISNMTVREMEHAPITVRKFYRKFEKTAEIISTNEKVFSLSSAYLKEGKFPKRMEIDTLHISLATVNKVDLLVSWNFRDIVNLNKIRIYNAVNIKLGYPLIEIRSPLEVLHG